MNILICDNDSQTLSFLESMISDHYRGIHQIFTFSNAADLFDFEGEPDLLLSDIKLDDVNGIEMCRDFRMEHPGIKIIFITGYPAEYCQEIFTYFRPFGFIGKPIEENILFKRIDTVDQIVQATQRVNFIHKGYSTTLEPRKILFVESNGRQKKIVMEDSEHLVNLPYEKFMEILPGYFLRCHNEFIVNMQYITQYNNDSIVMTNGRIIPIGRKYRAGFKDRYFTYKENENEYSRYNR